jgi:hypothetical protein
LVDPRVDPGEPESPRSPRVKDPSIAEIVPAILHSLGTLLSAKLRLLEREFTSDVAKLRATIPLFAAGALMALLALGLAGAGAALLLGEWLGSPGGGLLIVAALYGAVALTVLGIARSRIRRMNGFLRATLDDLKRDVEWLKDIP